MELKTDRINQIFSVHTEEDYLEEKEEAITALEFYRFQTETLEMTIDSIIELVKSYVDNGKADEDLLNEINEKLGREV